MQEQQSVQVGDIVRVTYPGMFYGQEVKILCIEPDRGGTLWYQLEVKWNDTIIRPSWFEIFEFERVKNVSQEEQS